MDKKNVRVEMQLSEEEIFAIACKEGDQDKHGFIFNKDGRWSVISFARAIEEALRAQADARPVAWMDPSKPLHMPITNGMKEQWEKDWPEQAAGFTMPLFTRASAATVAEPDEIDDPRQQIEDLRKAVDYWWKIAQAKHTLMPAAQQQSEPVVKESLATQQAEPLEMRDCHFGSAPLVGVVIGDQQQAERNQCDGCQSGAPLRGHMHVDEKGKAIMTCQRSRYEQQAEPGADERVAFEVQASEWGWDLRREANDPNEYLLASTAAAWGGWQARAAQSGQRAGVAEGWKVVPEQPTEAMVNAAIVRRDDWADIHAGRKSYPYAETCGTWRAILAAAPEAK